MPSLPLPLRAARQAAAASLLLTSILAGCVIVADGDPITQVPADRDAVIVTDECPGFEDTPRAVRVDGDRLAIDVTYGGCEAARYWVCWDGAFLESDPVQTRLVVHTEDTGDCDRAFEETIHVDLDPLLDAYVDSYGALDTIVMDVSGVGATYQP